jgi:hypothetical protein
MPTLNWHKREEERRCEPRRARLSGCWNRWPNCPTVTLTARTCSFRAITSMRSKRCCRTTPGAPDDSQSPALAVDDLSEMALTDTGKALIEQRFRDLDANPHASGPWEETKLRLMAPINLKNAVAATQRRKGAKTQGVRFLASFTRWMSDSSPSFPPHLPALCVLASWRPPSAVVLPRTGYGGLVFEVESGSSKSVDSDACSPRMPAQRSCP